MRTRLYLISPKLKLILSAIFLTLSLCFLWSSTHFALPTQGLYLRKAEAESCMAYGSWTPYPPSRGHTSGNAGSWYFSRRNDNFYIIKPFRNEGSFWDNALGPYHIAPMLPFRLDFDPIMTLDGGDIGFTAWENTVLVTTPDPNITRIELVQGGATAECTESAPGSGFWVGTLHTTDADKEKNLPTLVRAYGSGGTLLYSTPP